MSTREDQARSIRLGAPGRTPETARYWWLREALQADPRQPAESLTGQVRTDVAVVGGVYTRLWSAHHLKETNPQLDVTLIEADICGAGPSGRNGGFMNGFWQDIGMLVQLFGVERALSPA